MRRSGISAHVHSRGICFWHGWAAQAPIQIADHTLSGRVQKLRTAGDVRWRSRRGNLGVLPRTAV